MSPDPRLLLPLLLDRAAPAAAQGPGAYLHALEAAASTRQFAVLNLGLQSPGEATELCRVLAAIAHQAVRHGRPALPTLILSAGPVTLASHAASAAQLLLTLCLSLDAHPAIHAFAAETRSSVDPSPVSTPAWAALASPDTIARARSLGLHPERARESAATAAGIFEQTGDCLSIASIPPEAGILRTLVLL